MLKRNLFRSLCFKTSPYYRFQRFSSEVPDSQKRTSTEPAEFNTYKSFTEEVKHAELDPEQKTKWQRKDDREVLRERKLIRRKKGENTAVFAIVFFYFLFEDFIGLTFGSVHPPEPTLRQLIWKYDDYKRKREEEKKANKQLAEV